MQNAFSKEDSTLLTTDIAKCSFFNLIDNLWEGKEKDKSPLHRVFSLIRKMKAQSYLHESLLLNTELKEEKEMATRRCKSPVDLKAERFTFFRSFPKDGGWENLTMLPDEHILGYAVVVTLTLPNGECRSYVLEAVIHPPSVFIWNEQDEQQVLIEPITNYYIHNVREFKTMIGTSDRNRTIPITGSFFSQQNDLTSVCAHAALRMAINSSPIPMFQNSKLTNKQINDILGIDFSSPDKYVGHYEPIDSLTARSRTGLWDYEIETVIKTLGGRIISANFQMDTSIEYDHFIYPIMESGYPVIIGIDGWNAQKGEQFAHVVAVLGHTMNSDRWDPEARYGYGYFPMMDYLPAVEWADHLVIGDDNYGIYVTLPTDMIRNFIVPAKNPNLHVTRAIGIVPRDVKLSGSIAELAATQIAQEIIHSSVLDPPGEWLARMRNSILVCRTLLVSKSIYQKELNALLEKKLVMFSKDITKDIKDEINRLPDLFWVSEFSLPHIYTTNKHKLGDVLIDASASVPNPNNNQEVLKTFLFAWFPGFAISASNWQSKKWPLIDHVPLLRSSGEPMLLEW